MSSLHLLEACPTHLPTYPHPDVTTKDMISQGRQLRANLPCAPRGTRSLLHLMANWHGVCCGPIRFRHSMHHHEPLLSGSDKQAPWV